MEMTLFDFEVETKQYSSEEIQAAFELLKQYSKKQWNPYRLRIDSSDFPTEVKPFLRVFQEKGWLKYSQGYVDIKRELLDFPRSEEMVELFEERVEKLLKKPSVSWYDDILNIRNFFSPNFATREDELRFYELKRSVIKQAAIKLGLNHFMFVPRARGTKMDRFSSKFEKKHVIPMIAEYIIPMTDYDEVEAFFNNHAFFCGRRDWCWGCDTPPYPEYKTVIPNPLAIAAFAEAKDQKTVELILSYTGGSWSSHNSDRYTILYPEGWSYQKYCESLTMDDIENIYKDIERLKRLHGGGK